MAKLAARGPDSALGLIYSGPPPSLSFLSPVSQASSILQMTVYVTTEVDSSNCFLTTVFKSWKLTTLLKETLKVFYKFSLALEMY
jgi:hypothetical protein